MGYIYKITNQINKLVYIGQTTYEPYYRWQRHISDAYGPNIDRKYAIHKAIYEYGYQNFNFEVLEECNEKIINERERYWIEYYDSYNNGYNLTRGGAGKLKIDYDLVVKLYCTNNFSINELAKYLSTTRHTISKILSVRHIPHNEEALYNRELLLTLAKKATAKLVYCLDKETEIPIKEFESQTDAAKWVIEQGYSKSNKAKSTVASKISQVCNGKQKTAYGFKWSH